MGRSTKVGSFMVKPATLAQARTLTHSDSGKTYFLNAAGGFTITLPEPRGGINFEFIVKTAPTSGNYTIASKGAADVIGGQVVSSDVYHVGGRASVQLPGVAYANFVSGRSQIGDSLKMVSDGTYWYATGYCGLWDGIKMVEQSASPSTSPSISTSRSPSVSPSISPSES